ncbi:Hypothetical predicted protein [Lecanosticta acicola]|uniref:Uncharacterized protein n=1 Tax=Lecanosticta acicola TaxID=111012 RepID=A0AAI9E9X7_9PEZI|nr:Hypothetical predicted protein [Lecanosticta acicola]
MEGFSDGDPDIPLLGQIGQQIRGLRNQLAAARRETEHFSERLRASEQENGDLRREKAESTRRAQAIDQASSDLQKACDDLKEELRLKETATRELEAKLEEASRNTVPALLDHDAGTGRGQQQVRQSIETTRRRPRAIAPGFVRLEHEGDKHYVDMFDGHKEPNPQWHNLDLQEWRNSKALGKLDPVRPCVWKYSAIAGLPDERGDADKAKRGHRRMVEDTQASRPRDSVLDGQQATRKADGACGIPEYRLTAHGGNKDARERLQVSAPDRDATGDIFTDGAHSRDRSQTDDMSGTRLRLFGPRRDSLIPTETVQSEHRSIKKRAASPESEEAMSARHPRCVTCWKLGLKCFTPDTGRHCTKCKGKGMCVFKRCKHGLGCRSSHCLYVHPGQIDESRYIVEDGSFGEKRARQEDQPGSAARVPSPEEATNSTRGKDRPRQQQPVCVRCWRGSKWCLGGPRCSSCKEAGSQCIYKHCRHGLACMKKKCVYMHPDQYDPHQVAWQVEAGDLGVKNSEMGSQSTTRRTNDVLHRKAICKECFETRALCDFDDVCKNCRILEVRCVRVWCDEGEECTSRRCPAVHPGQVGKEAIVEQGRLRWVRG